MQGLGMLCHDDMGLRTMDSVDPAVGSASPVRTGCMVSQQMPPGSYFYVSKAVSSLQVQVSALELSVDLPLCMHHAPRVVEGKPCMEAPGAAGGSRPSPGFL